MEKNTCFKNVSYRKGACQIFFIRTPWVLSAVKEMAKVNNATPKIFLATQFSKNFFLEEIPDPYSKGTQGFDLNMDIAEDVCREIIKEILL